MKVQLALEYPEAGLGAPGHVVVLQRAGDVHIVSIFQSELSIWIRWFTTNECSRSCCGACDYIRFVKLSRIQEKMLRIADKNINAAFFSRFRITEIILLMQVSQT